MSTAGRLWLALIVNAAIVLSTAAVLVMLLKGRDLRRAAVLFRYFTTDSNILSALTSLIALPCIIHALRTGAAQLPRWMDLLRLAGTASVTVTLLTVACFLSPVCRVKGLYDGPDLYMHLIGPLLAIASFVLLESFAPVKGLSRLWGMLPVLVYAPVYWFQVVGRKGAWPDFYYFNQGGRWYISYAAMLTVTLLISLGLCALRNLFCD